MEAKADGLSSTISCSGYLGGFRLPCPLYKQREGGKTLIRWRTLGASLAFGILGSGCSPVTPKTDMNSLANEMVEFAKANPVVNDEYWRGKGILVCRPKTKQVCQSDGCKTVPALVWLRLKPETGSYSRCDSQGCDKYEGKVSHSGSWTTIDVSERALLARLAGGGSYVEVAAQGDAIYVSHGQCSKEM